MPSIDWASAPEDATHAWLATDGTVLHWLRFDRGNYVHLQSTKDPIRPADQLTARGSLVQRP